MRADGVIAKNAIRGAEGATFDLGPEATLDVHTFVILSHAPGTSLLSLSPVHDYRKARGGKVEEEHMVIAGCRCNFFRERPIGMGSFDGCSPDDRGRSCRVGDDNRTPGRDRASDRPSQGSQPHLAVDRAGRGRLGKSGESLSSVTNQVKSGRIRAQVAIPKLQDC